MTDSVERYLRAEDVAKRLHISRSTVDVLVSRGRLPRPIELSPRLKRWDRDAIDAALAGNPEIPHPAASIDETTRKIADDIIAKGRLSAKKGSRRQERNNVLPLARDRRED